MFYKFQSALFTILGEVMTLFSILIAYIKSRYSKHNCVVYNLTMCATEFFGSQQNLKGILTRLSRGMELPTLSRKSLVP